jgi:hypothetical protein
MYTLVNEFLLSMDGLDDRSATWLLHQGVSETALHQWPGPVGVTAIETNLLGGIFDLAEHGRRAFIQPILSGPGFTDIVDLVAWYPDNPWHWWTLCYTGVPLGDDQLYAADYWQNPVMLRATPLDWLRAGGDGVCILNWKPPAQELRTVPELICETVDHGEEVLLRLSAPMMHVPPITILKKDAA